MNRPYSLLVNRVCEAKTSFVGVSCVTLSVRHGAPCFSSYGAVSLNRIRVILCSTHTTYLKIQIRVSSGRVASLVDKGVLLPIVSKSH